MDEFPRMISADYRQYEPLRQADKDAEDDDDSSSDDFEFALATTDPDTGLSITAEEIFSGGRILPVYPIFNRDLLAGGRSSAAEEEKKVALPLERLLIEDRGDRKGSASSSPESGELEGPSAGTYCGWAPRSPTRSPELSRKSSSTGSSSSRRRGLREIVGGRSHSDGKEKFVLLERPPPEKKRSAPPNPNPKVSAAAAVKEGEKGKSGKVTKGGKATEMDLVTADRLFYGQSSGQGVNSRRRTYLGAAGRVLRQWDPSLGSSFLLRRFADPVQRHRGLLDIRDL